MLVNSSEAFVFVIFLVSIVISFGLFQVIFAPRPASISHDFFTSLMLGRFYIVHIPSIKSVAGKIATAAFFAPLIVTSPFKGVPPVMTNFSKSIPP